MAYKLAVKIATKSACYNDPRKMQGPLGAMLHSVGCSQPSAENWANRWNSPTATVCATYVIEPNYVIQVLPENKRPWTSGSGANGNANNYMFQAEMTEPACLQYQGGSAKFNVPADRLKEAQDFVTATYWTAVELYADRFKALGLDPTAMIPTKKHPTLISHAEGGAKYKVASNHGDPEHLWSQLKLPYTMDTFRRDVKLAMSATPTPPKTETVRLTAGTPYYKAPDGKTVAGKIEVTTNYTIVGHSGNYGKLKSGAGWVKLTDDPAPPTPTPTTGHLAAWADRNPIKRGTKGKHVEVLQAILYDKGYDIRQVDGNFGAVTENAVKAYQKDQKLTVDGWAGAQVWEALMR
ncbi:MAG TPA: peptidoglycan-binding domain-containing protein [Bacteroidales bacterium]|nr:peptidoglycan-binding domain-containing protein [Bacteroidales bacterium]